MDAQLQFDPATHRFEVDGEYVPSVTQILRSAGLINTAFYNEACAWRGSVVHRCCQLDDEGDLDEATVAIGVWPYLEGWRQFRQDTGFIPLLIERPVFHPIYRYAGILDRTGYLQREPAIIDLKTGAAERYHALQLAAYQFTLPDPRTYRRFVVRLRPGGYSAEEFPVDEVDQDFSVFLAALTLSGWLEKAA